MQKLNFFGVGPKIARSIFPWLAMTIILTIIKKDIFRFTASDISSVRIAGIIVLGLGLIFYFLTVPALLKGLKETRLMTKGGFYMCQNPLYASVILLIIPGVALLSNSWLILTTSIIGYIMFRINIHAEYSELEKVFGEEYHKYKKDTPEFFPFPVKKLFRR